MADLERRGTSPDGHHLDGVLTHDGDRFYAGKVDRKHLIVVFQQHHTLAGDAARSGRVFGRVERSEGFARIHRRAENQAQHAAGLVVEHVGRSLALAKQVEVRIGEVIIIVGVAGSPVQAVGPRTELHVETVLDSLFRIVHTAPVGNNHAVEGPVSFQDVVQQVLVVAAMLALIFIVGAHNGPRAALFDRSLERRKVDFVERTVVDDNVDAVAVHLLVVQCEMLDAGGHAVLLHALDIRNDHARREIGIFTHIFEIAAVERRAVDVHARAQQDIFFAVAGLFADGFAVKGRHGGIPRRGQTRQGGKSRTRVVGPAGLVPLVPQHFGTDSVGAVGAPHLGNAQPLNACRRKFRLGVEQADFLFERHAREGVLDPFFDGLRLVEVNRNAALRLLSAAAGDGRKGTKRSKALYQCSVLHFGKKIMCLQTECAVERLRTP